MKILIIEDDRLVADTLVLLLTSQAHAVEVVADGAKGWTLVQAYRYDLIILDLTLPEMDGLSLCQNIRSHNAQVPILILTGRDDAHTKATGLDIGADDYVVKPFESEELLARVRALLRRSGEPTQTVLTWNSLTLDPSSCQVTCQDKPIPFTPKEYALVELFLRNPSRVFSCSAILDHLWAYEDAPGEEAVRTHIKGLRQKLKAAIPSQDMIETVYGIGYRLKSEDLLAKKPTKTQKHSPASAQTLQEQIQKIWQESQPEVQKQLTMIHNTIVALSEAIEQQQSLRQHAPTQEFLPIALREAHSLAGSLGTFGFMQGSVLARQLKNQFDQIQKNQTIIASELSTLQITFKSLQQEINQIMSKRILLVDDDHSIQTVAKLSLEMIAGWQVLTASSGLEAIAIAHQEQPDAILLDVIMPEMDGLTTFAKLQENSTTQSIPVILMTAQLEDQDKAEYLSLGIQHTLAKPFEPFNLATAIAQQLGW